MLKARMLLAILYYFFLSFLTPHRPIYTHSDGTKKTLCNADYTRKNKPTTTLFIRNG